MAKKSKNSLFSREFKKLKKSAQSNKKSIVKKLPNYSNKSMAYAALSVFVLALSAFNLKTYFTPQPIYTTVHAAKDPYQEELAFWTDLAFKHPDYIDAWLALAELDLKEGNVEKAKVWVNKAKEIDPNSDKIIEIVQKYSLK